MDPFIKKLIGGSPAEQQEMLKSATDCDREALIEAVSERLDVNKDSLKRKFSKIISTVAACLLFKLFQELFLYLQDGSF